MLDRDELAARFAVALAGTDDYEPTELARVAVGHADAIRAALSHDREVDDYLRRAVPGTTREEAERELGLALVPVAPASGAPAPLPGAPLAAPSRPEWVRITSLNNGSWQPLTVGKVYAVAGWDEAGRAPRVLSDEQRERYLSSEGEKPDPNYPAFASWEPCAAPTAAKGSDTGTADAMPGVSPAATPAARTAAWVPSVGDVFAWAHETDAAATASYARVCVAPGLWSSAPSCAGLVRETIGPNATRFVRRATSSERAAAGLPVDESATKPVDREGLMAAMRAAFREWRRTPEDTRDTEVVATDAAIAFMAKGGVA